MTRVLNNMLTFDPPPPCKLNILNRCLMGNDFQLIYFYEDDITDINKNNAFTLSPTSVKVQKKI